MIPTKRSNYRSKATLEGPSQNSFSRASSPNYKKNVDKWKESLTNKFSNEKESRKDKNSNRKKNSENRKIKSGDITRMLSKDNDDFLTMALLLMALKIIKINPILHPKIKALSENIINKV